MIPHDSICFNLFQSVFWWGESTNTSAKELLGWRTVAVDELLGDVIHHIGIRGVYWLYMAILTWILGQAQELVKTR